MTAFRKLPVDVEAVRFNGGNFHEIWDFVGHHTPEGEPDHHIRSFGVAGTFVNWDDREIVGEVWDRLHSTWIGVRAGDWIIRGLQGEFYACRDDIFRESYAEIRDEDVLTFEQELSRLINRHSVENYSGTPDYILAQFLEGVLKQFELTIATRAKWRGESLSLPALEALQTHLVQDTNDVVGTIKKEDDSD